MLKKAITAVVYNQIKNEYQYYSRNLNTGATDFGNQPRCIVNLTRSRPKPPCSLEQNLLASRRSMGRTEGYSSSTRARDE